VESDSKTTLIVGLDTQTLIWALDEIESNEPEKENRALWLLDYLTAQKAQVVISTVVLGELLTDVPPSKHADFTAKLSQRFQIVPFDTVGASRSAALFSECLDLKPEDAKGRRKTYKADLMIVCQAWASGATVFYTDDERCGKMAKRAGMIPRPLPTYNPNPGKQALLEFAPTKPAKPVKVAPAAKAPLNLPLSAQTSRAPSLSDPSPEAGASPPSA
jgi:predicted nucleic acid-binding protein